MAYNTRWDALPEVEVLPNNFRRSVAGHQVGINQIRLAHPSGTPLHHHDEEEQAVMMLEGELDVTIGEETIRMMPGEVCVVPKGIKHKFNTVGVDALLLEVFAPMRLQNLVGFLGKNF